MGAAGGVGAARAADRPPLIFIAGGVVLTSLAEKYPPPFSGSEPGTSLFAVAGKGREMLKHDWIISVPLGPTLL